MHKYIWPSDVSKAARWYLQLFSALSNEMSLDTFLHCLEKDAPPRKRLYANLQRLVEQGLLTRSGTGHLFTYRLSNLGTECLARLSLFDIETPQTWDGNWRIVLFDVPEDYRQARNQIRRLLKELGFLQLQLSAWIHPFPCLSQFDQLRKAYGIEQHLHLIEATKFHVPLSISKQFEVTYPNYQFKKPV